MRPRLCGAGEPGWILSWGELGNGNVFRARQCVFAKGVQSVCMSVQPVMRHFQSIMAPDSFKNSNLHIQRLHPSTIPYPFPTHQQKVCPSSLPNDHLICEYTKPTFHTKKFLNMAPRMSRTPLRGFHTLKRRIPYQFNGTNNPLAVVCVCVSNPASSNPINSDSLEVAYLLPSGQSVCLEHSIHPLCI